MAKTSGGTSVRWVPMVGPDDSLDTYSNSWRPTNELPLKCKHCTFPDLDVVPNPYLIARGFSSPAESWSALWGNFLVKQRVRRILELSVPKACDYYPTAELKSKKPTPWFLAVPKQVVPAPGLSLWKPEKCSKCREPKLGYDSLDPKTRRYLVLDKCDPKGADLFKTSEWSARQTVEDKIAEINGYRKEDGLEPMPWAQWVDYLEPPSHKERWTRLFIERELLFSVRLAQLWKQAKVKGQLVVSYDFKNLQPTAEDLAWVDEKLTLLVQNGLVDAPTKGAKKKTSAKSKGGKAPKAAVSAAEKKQAAESAKWFAAYLKKNAKKQPAAVDFAAVEKKHKLKLPKSYRDFITKVGSKSFKDVNDMEGSTTKVLPPKQLDFRDYRTGALEDLDDDSAAIDGVMFAATDHGDVFVFDVSTKGSDYPVYYYNHELNTLEPWSSDFASCIKRFAERN